MNIKLAPVNGIVGTEVLANPAGAKQAAEKLDFLKKCQKQIAPEWSRNHSRELFDDFPSPELRPFAVRSEFFRSL